MQSPYAKIRKRSGRVVEFDVERITIAAAKALRATCFDNRKLA